MKDNVREFATGATRDTDENKLDVEAYLSPEFIRAFSMFMHFHQQMPDGSMRAGDNWQKGMPLDVLMKSATRHHLDWWLAHREYQISEGRLWAIFGLVFNAMAYASEYMKAHPAALPLELSAAHARRESDPRWKKRDK
jgi:hypothetical protein